MKLDYALLAERADFHKDNRIMIFGANSDTFIVDAVPAIIDLCITGRIFADDGERPEDHFLQIEIENPEGERRLADPPKQIGFPPPSGTSHHPPTVSVVLRIVLQCEKFGVYRIRLLGDGNELKSFSAAVKAKPKEASDGSGDN
jgi:hypothetical protein